MNKKKRNWAFVLYPESAPVDWKDQLQQSGIQACISPLHDKDTNPTGESKKAHYHIILVYDGPTTYNNVKSLTDSLNCPIPQPLEQVRGYYRYLTHKDNPEKYQYDEKLIDTINGFDVLSLCELTKSEVISIKKEIQQIIRSLEFTEYAQLMDYLLDNQLNNFYEVACNNTVFFDRYLGSCRYSSKDMGKSARELVTDLSKHRS